MPGQELEQHLLTRPGARLSQRQRGNPGWDAVVRRGCAQGAGEAKPVGVDIGLQGDGVCQMEDQLVPFQCRISVLYLLGLLPQSLAQ